MRYLIGLLVTIGLLILLIVIIVQGGGSSKSKVPQSKKTLVSYAQSDAVARLTIDGPINAQQDHKQIQITVGRDNVVIETIIGYNHSVTKQQNFANTEASYNAFLSALDLAGFTKGDTTTPSLKSESGYCPLGNRFIIEFIQNGTSLERFWATDCGKPKSYLGSLPLTLSLFQAQVHDYNTTTSEFLSTP